MVNYYLLRTFVRSSNFFDIIGILWQTQGIVFERFINKKLKINRGNKLVSLVITKDMVGYKLEDFYLSKRMGWEIHKKKNKKKRKGRMKKR